jgi:putative acetyltransferase
MLEVMTVRKEGRELDEIRQLFREYVSSLKENLCFQHFDDELADPLRKYGGPSGELLLAYWNKQVAGCIAFTKLEDGVCEMKRLFVRPSFRNKGIGDELINRLIAAARERGYSIMKLDTLERLSSALRLYLVHGFETTTAYYDNPLPGVVYMQKNLEGEGGNFGSNQ